jgi:hypothetical protein
MSNGFPSPGMEGGAGKLLHGTRSDLHRREETTLGQSRYGGMADRTVRPLQDKQYPVFVGEPAVHGSAATRIHGSMQSHCDGTGRHLRARRQSGGGADYHDQGNTNFTFISHKKDMTNNGTSTFCSMRLPLVSESELSGRNDVLCKGKCSGNALQVPPPGVSPCTL